MPPLAVLFAPSFFSSFRSEDLGRSGCSAGRGLVLLAVLVLGLLPLASPPAAAVDRELNRAINQEVRGANRVARDVGVLVVAQENGEEIYSYNADERRIIASNTKLMTSAAALDRLGPGYMFETWVLGRGRVTADGVLEGDVAILGGGDPNISERATGDDYRVFRAWAEELRARGVRAIDGDIFLIHGFFEDEEIHPDWPEDQLSRWYEAPVAALSFNDNCAQVRVTPQRQSQPVVDVLPRLDLFRVRNLTTPGGRSQRLRIQREPESSQIEVRGTVSRYGPPLDAWVTVPDPVRYFGLAVQAAWAQEGIVHRGRLVAQPWLPAGGWTRWTVHRSDLLSTLEVVNKRSQNFYAESVLKTLGAEACGRGSWAGGLRAVREFLDRIGIEPGTYSMADGSGMSRNNRFAPRQLVHLLRYMQEHRWGGELLRTLPYGGEEGLSWERRLERPPYRGNVFAKTGTLSGVSSLSGYAKGRSGRLYVFSILMNGTRTTWQARDAQDAIVRAIIDQG